MGAGILPTTIYNGKLYFLFGKESKYEDSAPGFSDFGGGTDYNETFLETAVREAEEEFTGFLGNSVDIRKMLKKGTYNIDYTSINSNHKTYRMHIFPFEYNEWLPFFYNNNQHFLQKKLPPKIFKTTKIFEKSEIKWICVDELAKMKSQFRSYFQDIIDIILREQNQIKKFIKKSNLSHKILKTKKYKKNNKKTKRITKNIILYK